MCNPSTCDSQCNKEIKIYKYLDKKNCFLKIVCLFQEKNEILNTNEISFVDKKKYYVKKIIPFSHFNLTFTFTLH